MYAVWYWRMRTCCDLPVATVKTCPAKTGGGGVGHVRRGSLLPYAFVVVWDDVRDRRVAAALDRGLKRPTSMTGALRLLTCSRAPQGCFFRQVATPLSLSGAPLRRKRNAHPWAMTHEALAPPRSARTVRANTACVSDNRNSCLLVGWSFDSTCPWLPGRWGMAQAQGRLLTSSLPSPSEPCYSSAGEC